MTYLEIPISQVNTSTIDLGFTAEAGDWTLYLSHNGLTYVHNYTYGLGDPVIIDNVLQNYRSHSVKFVNAAGDLMNDTLYTITTNDITLSNGQINTIYQLPYTASSEGEASFQSPILVNAKSVQVFAQFGVQYQLVAYSSFDPATGTINYTSDSGSSAGQNYIVFYQKWL